MTFSSPTLPEQLLSAKVNAPSRKLPFLQDPGSPTEGYLLGGEEAVAIIGVVLAPGLGLVLCHTNSCRPLAGITHAVFRININHGADFLLDVAHEVTPLAAVERAESC